FAQNIQTDLGVPLIACKIQHCTAGSPTSAQQAAINAGIAQAAATTSSNVILGPDLSTMTTTSTDGLHLVNQADAYEAAAKWAQALLATTTGGVLTSPGMSGGIR